MTQPSELLSLLAIEPASAEERVLRVLIELGAQVVDAEEGSLLVHDTAKNDLVFAMTVGGPEVLIGQRLALGQGLTGLAAATREVQIGAPTFQGVVQEKGPEAVIAAPMLVGDDLIGVITAVSFAKGKRFSGRDGDLYARLAAVAGVVVDQRRHLNAAAGKAQAQAQNSVEAGIATSIARIAKHRPDALTRLATIVAEVEALASGPGADLEI
ncbi:MAG: GAF domain-containing protein [Labilithrix sp.]|nr:GAF domain-containing protein [Labilithrix sp.]MCW5816183.1 GAF domain-containing protein [Labilithrix sp.]